jgi:hypothetical protein
MASPDLDELESPLTNGYDLFDLFTIAPEYSDAYQDSQNWLRQPFVKIPDEREKNTSDNNTLLKQSSQAAASLNSDESLNQSPCSELFSTTSESKDTVSSYSTTEPESQLQVVQYTPLGSSKNSPRKHSRKGTQHKKRRCIGLSSRPDALKTDKVCQ